jgi:hypothetical protein
MMRVLTVVTVVAGCVAPAWAGEAAGSRSELAWLGDAVGEGAEQEPSQDEKAAREAERQAEREAREAEREAREEERRQREAERAEEQKQREEERVQRSDELYDEGTEALDESQWDRAIRAFGQVCALGGRRCDGALYWKAYALSRRGKRSEALATLGELQKSHPQSRWSGDAKALELEIGRSAGKPVSPGSPTAEAAEGAESEELKLLALDALMSSDPARALPLLEEVLRSQATPRIKDRALFVLSQSETPKARELLLGIVRGGGNPDLKRKAVRYLGMSGEADSLKALADLYVASAEPEVKRAILEAFVIADDQKHLLAVAQAEKDPRLRRQAIEQLGAVGGVAELQQLYRTEPSGEVREAILNAYVAADAEAALLDAARNEKDSGLRIQAIQNLGATGGSSSAGALQQLYASERDPKVRRAVLDAFLSQDNCQALIQIGRGEKDPALRRSVVEHLSSMECPEATDFLLEILKK